KRAAWLKTPASGDVFSFTRKKEKNEFFVLINLSNRRIAGSVDLTNAAGFTLVKIEGMPTVPPSELPEFNLGGFEWRIYQRPASAK
ncbi:MAG TPA: hypothetical protein PKA41_12790, partial [Verrucomicrobiota bacterium]|nr:hypothetical protein [Verrucomicrobiota bacterium]